MDLTNRLSGKVAIVTGGAGGLGSATVRRLVAEDARVVVADIRGDAAKTLADEFGKSALPVEFDYRDESSVQALVHETIRQFGRIDLLHNNAVGGAATDLAILDARTEDWDEAYEINVRGYMLATKYALPHMIEQKVGTIVNMSSGSALKGDLARTAYGVLKSAVITLTQYTATQYGKDGVRCVSITPGAMLTDSMRAAMGAEGIAVMERHHLTPRLGDPGDVAALIAHLTSDDSKFITGINIPVDGGLLAHNPTYADFRG